MTEIAYVSVDPGGAKNRRSTGVATWTADATLIGKTRMSTPDLDVFLQGLEGAPGLVKFIIEDYRVNPHITTHGGSRVVTIQIIGQLTAFCRRWDVEYELQRPNCKDIAMKWAQVPKTWKGKHMPDDVSAYCHGYYYLFKQGLIRPKVLDD